MDEQQKTDDTSTSDDGVKIIVNTPPKEETPSSPTDSASPAVNEITPPPADEPKAEETPMAEPPAEEEESDAGDEAVASAPADKPEVDGSKSEDVQPESPVVSPAVTTESAEPAAMGVAASEMKKHPHRNNKKFAALVTVFAALVLAGVAVFVYMSANKNTEETNDSDTQQTQQETVTPATAEDVDQTSKEVEDAVNSLDETQDFADDELSDSNLEL